MKRPALFRRKQEPHILAVGTTWARAIASLHATNFARGWSTSDVEHLLEQPTVLALVACPVGAKADPHDGEAGEAQAVGFCLLRRIGTGPDSEAEILSIAVEKSWRNQGVAEALMREAILHLSHERVENLFLEVAADNGAAIALYAKFGFETVGERPGYYAAKTGKTGPRVKALIQRLTLSSPL
ncbi:MAG: N-acetyltransferase [Pseudomonadota bacterium]